MLPRAGRGGPGGAGRGRVCPRREGGARVVGLRDALSSRARRCRPLVLPPAAVGAGRPQRAAGVALPSGRCRPPRRAPRPRGRWEPGAPAPSPALCRCWARGWSGPAPAGRGQGQCPFPGGWGQLPGRCAGTPRRCQPAPAAAAAAATQSN